MELFRLPLFQWDVRKMDVKTHSFKLNGNQLKLIAIAAMALDHCVAVFVPQQIAGRWILRMLGRMAAPIMCYLIAEGYWHTSNLKKYMARLFVVAVISHFPYNLCFGYDVWHFWEATDVMVALFAGLAALAAFEKKELPLWLRLFFVAVCCAFAYSANWNYIAVLWILGFGVFHGDKRRQLAAFTAVAGLYLLQPFIYGMNLAFISYIRRFGVFLVIPLLLAYSGERGKKNKWIKWAFYWFYPVHLWVIYLINQFV